MPNHFDFWRQEAQRLTERVLELEAENAQLNKEREAIRILSDGMSNVLAGLKKMREQEGKFLEEFILLKGQAK